VAAGLAASCLVALATLPPAFAAVLGVYLSLNLAYSFGLKRIVILDVMIVAIGFVLRAIAGAVVIRVDTSPWLILCTLLLALLVGLGKRHHELSVLEADAANHRTALQDYTHESLSLMMGIAGAAAVVSYALYTMAEETIARYNSRHLLYTVPFVIFGVFRYLHIVLLRRDAGDPARTFMKDRPTLLNVVLWAVAVCLIIYGPLLWKQV
jgi:4-hydroxybenzoate polyprenyltransferase